MFVHLAHVLSFLFIGKINPPKKKPVVPPVSPVVTHKVDPSYGYKISNKVYRQCRWNGE